MLLHRRYLQKRLYLCREFYRSPEKKAQSINAYYFVYSDGKTPASPDPSGLLKLSITCDKQFINSHKVTIAGSLQSLIHFSVTSQQ
jgi:hypothetical protein